MVNSKIIVSVFFLIYLLSGCGAKPSINEIEVLEHDKEQENIYLSKKEGYKVFINDDDEIEYICSDPFACNNKLNEDLEYFYMNNYGYYPPFNHEAKEIQCGIGSFYGWLSVLVQAIPLARETYYKNDYFKNGEIQRFPLSFKNYDVINADVCQSKYAKLDSTQIVYRIGFSLMFYGTPFISAGTLHTEKFDEEYFKKSLHKSNHSSSHFLNSLNCNIPKTKIKSLFLVS